MMEITIQVGKAEPLTLKQKFPTKSAGAIALGGLLVELGGSHNNTWLEAGGLLLAAGGLSGFTRSTTRGVRELHAFEEKFYETLNQCKAPEQPPAPPDSLT